MNTLKTTWRVTVAGLAFAAGLSGCGGDNSAAPAAPGPQTTVFSTFAKEIYAMPENVAPTSLDNLTFNFDADEDPTAFDTLLMMN